MVGRPPESPLFPSTTVFRSLREEPHRLELGVAEGRRDARRPENPLGLVGGLDEGVATAEAGPEDGQLGRVDGHAAQLEDAAEDRKSTRLNSSHANILYAVFC